MDELGGWIRGRRDELVGLLQALIRARSENPPGDEAEAAAIVAASLRALGAEVTVLEPLPRRVNVVGTLDSGRPGPAVLCDAHLDTVPAGEGWTVRPFDAAIRDGHIYGRGATDHKSPVAALLQAIACLRATGRLRGRLCLIFDADEEQGGRLGMQHVLQNLAPEVDCALYACATSYPPEGASFFSLGVDNVFHASVGLLRLRVRYTSQVAYQVAPTRWWYPAEVAARVAVRLPAAFEPPRWFGPMPRARLRAAHDAEQVWDVFVLPEETREGVEQTAAEAIAAECALCSGAGAAVEVLDFVPPASCSPTHPLVRSLVEAGRAATGRAPMVTPVAAVTGMSRIQQKLGVPIAAFGYGRVDLDHAPDERISIEDLEASAVAYAEALAHLR